MRKFGFKVFDTNLHNAPDFVRECADYAAQKEDMFAELMISSRLHQDEFSTLKEILKNVEVRIHAAHSSFGFDLGNKNSELQNRQMFEYAQIAADIFASPSIVVHAGCGHGIECIKETMRQIKLLNDERIVIENLPYFDKSDGYLCGNTAEEIKYIKENTGCGFCFDFAHAICAANSLNLDIEKHLKSFLALNPTVYHLCDGNLNGPTDEHLHYGEGNYPLKHFLNDYTDDNAYITMETGDLSLHNDLSVKDYKYLKTLLND